ncbi:MAG: response regulator transcription factor [Cyclobacteriaceae bacterium]|nr:response regulator transcription factor [Cyclobacteriaceae bacterium]
MKPLQPKHILLVDDHVLFTKALKKLLALDLPETNFYTAANGKEALDMLAQHPVDVLVLDISMPEMNGYDACIATRKNYPDTRIIILTQHNTEFLTPHFMKQGAGSVLQKNTDELVEAIQSVWETGRYISNKMRSDLEKIYDQDEVSLPLTKQARELISHISQGKSSKEIATLMCLSENTIMLKQTHTRNTDELVSFAFKIGLLNVN